MSSKILLTSAMSPMQTHDSLFRFLFDAIDRDRPSNASVIECDYMNER